MMYMQLTVAKHVHNSWYCFRSHEQSCSFMRTTVTEGYSANDTAQ